MTEEKNRLRLFLCTGYVRGEDTSYGITKLVFAEDEDQARFVLSVWVAKHHEGGSFKIFNLEMNEALTA